VPMRGRRACTRGAQEEHSRRITGERSQEKDHRRRITGEGSQEKEHRRRITRGAFRGYRRRRGGMWNRQTRERTIERRRDTNWRHAGDGPGEWVAGDGDISRLGLHWQYNEGPEGTSRFGAAPAVNREWRRGNTVWKGILSCSSRGRVNTGAIVSFNSGGGSTPETTWTRQRTPQRTGTLWGSWGRIEAAVFQPEGGERSLQRAAGSDLQRAAGAAVSGGTHDERAPVLHSASTRSWRGEILLCCVFFRRRRSEV